VNRYTKVVDGFDATHFDPEESAHLHGHHFAVEAVEQSQVDTGLQGDLAVICRELDRHRLDEMLVGGAQDGPGLASWIMERLLTKHPRVISVEVSFLPGRWDGVSRTVR
jgi:hypothetical protein